MKLALPDASAETIFAPVQSQTAFEETLERLGTAIKLGLLEPGARLPAERELCRQLGISRSTLRQALTALVQSGHLHAIARAQRRHVRRRVAAAGRRAVGGAARGLARRLRPAARGRARRSPCWRPSAPSPQALEPLDELVDGDGRHARGLPRATARPTCAGTSGWRRRRAARACSRRMTEAQGQMTDLIAYIAHPPELLAWSNQQHAKMLVAVRRRDGDRAMRIMAEHLKGTEHVLAGLLPAAS